MEALSALRGDPRRPFVVILGGAKVSDKIKILERLMEKADAFIIGGAMGTTFRLAQGYEVGKSFVEDTPEARQMALDILETAKKNNTEFLLPADTRHAADFADDAPTECTAPWEQGGAIPADREGIDIGDLACEEFAAKIAEAGTIVWNGPMGVFEKRGFDIGTKAVGAAIACPDQKVIALEADGSGMYTVQALWTMVREQLDITVVLLNNRSYAILNIELSRVGVEQPGPTALSLLDLSNPDLEWTDIARGMGMQAVKTETVAAFDQAFADAMAQSGPCLIEVML